MSLDLEAPLDVDVAQRSWPRSSHVVSQRPSSRRPSVVPPIPVRQSRIGGTTEWRRKRYAIDSDEVIWLNSRAFVVHEHVGKGGYAHVFQCEMLVPTGMELVRDASTGKLHFNEDGNVLLEVAADEDFHAGIVEAAGDLHDRAATADESPQKRFSEARLSDCSSLDEALKSRGSLGSAPAPDGALGFAVSRSQPEDLSGKRASERCVSSSPPSGRAGVTFKMAPQEQNGDQKRVNFPKSSKIASSVVGSSEDDLDVPVHTLWGSGAFYALKIQTTNSRKQFDLFKAEVGII